MRKLALQVGIVAAALGLAATSAQAQTQAPAQGPAQPRPGGACNNPQRFRKYMTFRLNDTLDQINATPEQRQRVLAIADPLMTEAQQLIAQHRQAHAQMFQEWQKDTPDPNVFRNIVDQQANNIRQFGQDMTAGFLQVHQLLSPQQRAQLVQLWQQEMQCHGRW